MTHDRRRRSSSTARSVLCMSRDPPEVVVYCSACAARPFATDGVVSRVVGYRDPMPVAVIVPEEKEYAALVRHAAENDLIIVDLQHLVRTLRHDVANAEAATKIAQEATERLRAERRQGIADIRELLERFERR